MKCKDCNCCRLGFFESKPDKYVCIGVHKPFVIDDIDEHCTEYKYKRETTREDAIAYVNRQLENGFLDLSVVTNEYELKVIAEAMELLTIVDKWNSIPLVSPITVADLEEALKFFNSK